MGRRFAGAKVKTLDGITKASLADCLEAVKSKNCKVNEGYLKAPGLR